MSSFDDYGDEMSHELERFADGVRAAATRMPTPSPALANMLTHGISSEPTKRSIFMRARAYVAGLGVVAKVMLGAGVAAAATTGAVAAVEASNHDHHEVAVVADTTTTTTAHHEERKHDEPRADDPAVIDEPTTTTTMRHEEPRHEEPHTTTTLRHEEPRPTTTTTMRHEEPTTTTTWVEHTNPESITLTCESHPEPNRVVCWWTGSENPEHRCYALLRVNQDSSDGRVLYQTEDHREYVDTTPAGGQNYYYRVVSLREDGSTEAHSNGVPISCC